MKTFKTASEAIEHSIHHNEAAYCKDTAGNLCCLVVNCDDHNDMVDFWADDEETEAGMLWRVIIAKSTKETDR